MKKTTVTLALGLSVLFLLGTAPRVLAQGHWEFSGHYGRWNLKLLGSILEGLVEDVAEEEIKGAILEELQAQHPQLSEESYSQVFDFRSSGDNFGLGIRWYPGGYDGSFSLGLSVEKSTFKIRPSAAVELALFDGAIGESALFSGAGALEALVEATSFHLTLRWDIAPRGVVHPFLTLGGGISTARALDASTFSYEYSGRLTAVGHYDENYADSVTKTLREIKDEEETDLPNFIPIVEITLGLKARVARSIHLLAEAGIFNGFILRGGLAVRL